MNIKNEIKKLIENEDRLNPLTDQLICEKLNITRENVTVYRKKLKIMDSRQRKRSELLKEIRNEVNKFENSSISSITSHLNKMGCNTSRNVVKKIVSELKDDNNDGHNEIAQVDYFNNLIGFNQSLKSSIMQAKAAILYPPFGLSTLIIGESGVGKSNFAKCMYEFAVQNNVIDKDKLFIVFNCADYSDNPQLLLSILFGYKKGTFTGAEKDTVGLVEKANEGILFLDEIHRLPPKGQEILFSILDNGKFRRMGETNIEREVRVLIIGATTENIESSLLLSFRRRIPMVINLPNYREKECREKIELIKFFSQKECNRINKKLFVEADVIKILLNCYLEGNIGQLKSEIQVLCAKSFMKSISKKSETLTVGINDIPQYTSNINGYSKNNGLQKGTAVTDCIFVPSIDDNHFNNKYNDNYSLPENIYTNLIEKYNELKLKASDENEIYDTLSELIITEFNKLDFNESSGEILELYNLKSIVSEEVIDAVLKIEREIKESYKGQTLNRSAFSYLAIHLEETLKRLRNNESIINFNTEEIQKKYRNEYLIAKRLSKYLSETININIPETEVGFITVYIKTIFENKYLNNRVAIIVISHGQIASEIVKVVKKFISGCSITSIDMPLDEDPNNFYNITLNVAKKVHEGKGILFLVDMGSLIYFGNHVYEDSGIETETIDRVDLLTAIEAARKSCIVSNSLQDIYFSLVESKIKYPLLSIKSNNKKLAIITICLTGEGAAKKIKEILSGIYGNIEIISLGIANKNLENRIIEISNEYNLIAITGTINPEIEGINFLPFNEKLLLNVKNKLDIILNGESIDNKIIRKENVLIISNAKDKRSILDLMISKLINDGSVKKEYIDSVFEREKDVPTFFKNNIAIPHGHPDYVNRSSIIIAKLDEPVYWGIGSVKIVCLLALKYSDKKLFSKILKLFSCGEINKKINSLNSQEQLYKIIINNLDKDGGN
jgi:transcriptional regulator with AAA-type ATPase domain/transcriptional regulatory protein LevR